MTRVRILKSAFVLLVFACIATGLIFMTTLTLGGLVLGLVLFGIASILYLLTKLNSILALILSQRTVGPKDSHKTQHSLIVDPPDSGDSAP